jgi:hypothetical protein
VAAPPRPDLQLKAERVQNRHRPVQANSRLAALEFDKEAQSDPSRSRKLGLGQAHLLADGPDGLADCLEGWLHEFTDRGILQPKISRVHLNFPIGASRRYQSIKGQKFPDREILS